MIVIVIVPTIVVMTAVMLVIMFLLIKGLIDLLGEGLFGDAVNLANGDFAFGGHLCARFKLRSKQRSFAMSPTKLALQQTKRRFDDARLPSTF